VERRDGLVVDSSLIVTAGREERGERGCPTMRFDLAFLSGSLSIQDSVLISWPIKGLVWAFARPGRISRPIRAKGMYNGVTM
jgi:hypothetical protein